MSSGTRYSARLREKAIKSRQEDKPLPVVEEQKNTPFVDSEIEIDSDITLSEFINILKGIVEKNPDAADYKVTGAYDMGWGRSDIGAIVSKNKKITLYLN